MPIKVDEKTRTFNIQTPNSSYIFGILKDKFLAHLYYGKRVEHTPEIADVMRHDMRGNVVVDVTDGRHVAEQSIMHEYPVYGSCDMRTPAFHALYPDGSRITDWKYIGYKVYGGKKKLEGLPATYVESESEASTLEIYLRDNLTGLEITLSYTAFEDYDAIARSVHFKNTGNGDIMLSSVYSLCTEFVGKNFNLSYLVGGWGKERHVHTVKLDNGGFSIDSKHGRSSHYFNPFIVLSGENATEDMGDAYGFSLVYSGNFSAEVNVDANDLTRVLIGINPFDFSWKLAAGEEFQTPEAVSVYSCNGIGEMSRTYHRLYRKRLCRGNYRDIERPVLLNNWEGTYFDFDEEKLLEIAKVSKSVGVELFVLDDGWFGERNDSTSSLGDWYVNKKKLPDGIDGLAKKIEAMGMKFGLWFEPEMISPVSKLYEKHPDWCLKVEGRKMTEGRCQFVLDLSRKDVHDYIYNMLDGYLSSAPISYIKWDMNRELTEVGSAVLESERQGEVAHRYVLSLYDILEKICTKYPNLIIEGCSSGGGRYDPGMLYYCQQIWVSDTSDAVERLYMQHGTSYVYPFSTMGAHVSAVPNHQVMRNTSLDIRRDAAIMGQFGYELDITKMSGEELEILREQIKMYKELGPVFHRGELYRLRSPFNGNLVSWEFISEDGNTVVLCIYRILSKAYYFHDMLKLKGLSQNAVYECEQCGKLFGGDMLMNIGLNMSIYFDMHGDFVSKILVFKKR